MTFPKISLHSLVCAAFISLTFFSVTVPRAEAQIPPARALFLDLETVFAQSSVGKGIRGQLEGMLSEIATREEKALADFKVREEQLISAAENLSAADGQKDWQAIQLEKEAQGNIFQLERTAVRQAAGDARKKVNAVLNTIMQEVLVERGANMVLSTAAVHVGGVDYDVTAEVIARLNKRMPSLVVQRPK